eukprot:403331884
MNFITSKDVEKPYRIQETLSSKESHEQTSNQAQVPSVIGNNCIVAPISNATINMQNINNGTASKNIKSINSKVLSSLQLQTNPSKNKGTSENPSLVLKNGVKQQSQFSSIEEPKESTSNVIQSKILDYKVKDFQISSPQNQQVGQIVSQTQATKQDTKMLQDIYDVSTKTDSSQAFGSNICFYKQQDTNMELNQNLRKNQSKTGATGSMLQNYSQMNQNVNIDVSLYQETSDQQIQRENSLSHQNSDHQFEEIQDTSQSENIKQLYKQKVHKRNNANFIFANKNESQDLSNQNEVDEDDEAQQQQILKRNNFINGGVDMMNLGLNSSLFNQSMDGDSQKKIICDLDDINRINQDEIGQDLQDLQFKNQVISNQRIQLGQITSSKNAVNIQKIKIRQEKSIEPEIISPQKIKFFKGKQPQFQGSATQSPIKTATNLNHLQKQMLPQTQQYSNLLSRNSNLIGTYKNLTDPMSDPRFSPNQSSNQNLQLVQIIKQQQQTQQMQNLIKPPKQQQNKKSQAFPLIKQSTLDFKESSDLHQSLLSGKQQSQNIMNQYTDMRSNENSFSGVKSQSIATVMHRNSQNFSNQQQTSLMQMGNRSTSRKGNRRLIISDQHINQRIKNDQDNGQINQIQTMNDYEKSRPINDNLSVIIRRDASSNESKFILNPQSQTPNQQIPIIQLNNHPVKQSMTTKSKLQREIPSQLQQLQEFPNLDFTSENPSDYTVQKETPFKKRYGALLLNNSEKPMLVKQFGNAQNSTIFNNLQKIQSNIQNQKSIKSNLLKDPMRKSQQIVASYQNQQNLNYNTDNFEEDPSHQTPNTKVNVSSKFPLKVQNNTKMGQEFSNPVSLNNSILTQQQQQSYNNRRLPLQLSEKLDNIRQTDHESRLNSIIQQRKATLISQQVQQNRMSRNNIPLPKSNTADPYTNSMPYSQNYSNTLPSGGNFNVNVNLNLNMNVNINNNQTPNPQLSQSHSNLPTMEGNLSNIPQESLNTIQTQMMNMINAGMDLRENHIRNQFHRANTQFSQQQSGVNLQQQKQQFDRNTKNQSQVETSNSFTKNKSRLQNILDANNSFIKIQQNNTIDIENNNSNTPKIKTLSSQNSLSSQQVQQ